MKELLSAALNTVEIKNASYGDIRLIETKSEIIVVKDGKIGTLIQEDTIGYGIRVIKNGAWGFASGNEMTEEAVKKTAALATTIAEASSLAKKREVKLSAEPAYQDKWTTPILIDPFKVSINEKLGIMYDIDSICRKSKDIRQTRVFMKFIRENKHFASTEGAAIEQTIYISGGGFSVTASNADDIQMRSYPLSFDGLHRTMGYEIIPAMDMVSHAERVREEAVALLSAKECPVDVKKDVILMPGQLVLQIHESAGHASELDRVLGYEADFAGTSFLTLDKMNHFQYGSPIVNLVADSTIPTGLATQGYDDDGVKAQRWHIVQDGIFKGYMVNRETAAETGIPHSFGCNRSEGYSSIPITRISNLSLMPHQGTLEELVADTQDGILMDTNRSWSIDQKRLNFQFGCEIGWEIKKGKKKKMLKNPYYKGITPEFWNSCDFICGTDDWELLGVMNCGKGQPTQTIQMSHGCSPARFRQVVLGP